MANLLPFVSASASRRLFLGAQGLLDDPERRVTGPSLQKLIERLGFVQVDTINVVARAHDLTLFSRLDGYRPEHLRKLLEDKRSLFEAFTHDASVIPTAWFGHWKPRFARDRERIHAHAWWQHHFRGTDGARVVRDVKARIEREGPLKSADFEHPEKRGPWWGWKPQKAALDFLWRSGELMVPRREGFQKVYDLTERVLPDHHALPCPEPAEHLEWACATAAERLWVFTPKELAEFWASIEAVEAKGWCERAAKAGRIVPVSVEGADGEIRPAFALPGWEARLAKLPDPPERTRLLCPFDPVLRDRARALRRFGFDYRFEAFVPEPKRQYGYFVLPILEGERLVGRLDPKLHRDRGLLEVKGLWWEPGVRPTKARTRGLGEALERLAGFLEAEEIRLT
ncbi:winged helix-turn-helix domain-containing protein [Geothrix fermentans]|uniref:winged helix-turn-helix domain-containing protein n=1 Tax=Geothrix fermentans TaxID=44676 RepID=UPI00047C0C2A|nr:crosslink repair DNA glycosylase YcaQ family protein [Geothrix fermentans]